MSTKILNVEPPERPTPLVPRPVAMLTFSSPNLGPPTIARTAPVPGSTDTTAAVAERGAPVLLVVADRGGARRACPPARSRPARRCGSARPGSGPSGRASCRSAGRRGRGPARARRGVSPRRSSSRSCCLTSSTKYVSGAVLHAVDLGRHGLVRAARPPGVGRWRRCRPCAVSARSRAARARPPGGGSGSKAMGLPIIPARKADCAVVEVRGVDAEVRLGAGLHAVGAVAEVHGVEVALEDLRLGHLLLEAAGQDRLAGLAVEASGRRRPARPSPAAG